MFQFSISEKHYSVAKRTSDNLVGVTESVQGNKSIKGTIEFTA